jgi:hypothetical protein
MRTGILLPMICLLASGCGSLLHAPQAVVRAPAAEIAALPPGATVGVIRYPQAETLQSITGIVLQAGPQGVALMNCRCVSQDAHKTPGLSDVPGLGRLSKQTSPGKELIPVLWLPTAEIESAVVLEPPPENFTPQSQNINLAHGFVAEQRGVDYDFSIDDRR